MFKHRHICIGVLYYIVICHSGCISNDSNTDDTDTPEDTESTSIDTYYDTDTADSGQTLVDTDHDTSEDTGTSISDSSDPVVENEELIWQNSTNAEMTQSDAIVFCDSLSLDGYDNWRLPTIDELRRLILGCSNTETYGACQVSGSCLLESCRDVDLCSGCNELEGPNEGCYLQPHLSADPNLFGSCFIVRSSSAVTNKAGYSWGISFDTGNIYSGRDDKYAFVRCVRQK